MCGVGQVRLCVCVCVIAGMPSSCRSVGESECGVGQVRLCMCVSYEERRVAVGLPDSECVVSGRSVCLCVCHTKNTGSRRFAGESECVV